MKGPKVCRWWLSDDGDSDIWHAGCGQEFQFIDGTPADNKMRFCPYCGGVLKVVKT